MRISENKDHNEKSLETQEWMTILDYMIIVIQHHNDNAIYWRLFTGVKFDIQIT